MNRVTNFLPNIMKSSRIWITCLLNPKCAIESSLFSATFLLIGGALGLVMGVIYMVVGMILGFLIKKLSERIANVDELESTAEYGILLAFQALVLGIASLVADDLLAGFSLFDFNLDPSNHRLAYSVAKIFLSLGAFLLFTNVYGNLSDIIGLTEKPLRERGPGISLAQKFGRN